MEEFANKARNIKTKEDFIDFMDDLIEDLKNNPEDWTHKKLGNYLMALQGWAVDMDDFYTEHRKPIPENVNWSVFADMLVAAKMYE